jgi:EmrB/QacA subfamily drug resistance transporter
VSEVIRRLAVEPRRPASVREHPHAQWLAVIAVCVGAFMGQLDASIVTVALPDIRDDLHVSLGAVEWVSLSYLLVLVGTISAVGRLADMLGRKLLYVYGFAVFTLASLGCGLAPTLSVLLILRVVQGVGAAMLQANSVALIRTTVRGDSLSHAIGLQGAAQAIGLAIGPAVGGLLVSAGGWRWVFYVNVPVGVLGVALGVLLLPRTRVRAPLARFDGRGFATLLPASGSLLLALSLVGRDGPSTTVIALLAASAALWVAFVLSERRPGVPLVDLRLLRSRAVATGLSSGLLAYLVLFGVLFVTPLHLQSTFAESPGVAGLTLAALPFALGLAAPIGSRLGPAATVVAGPALAAVACAILAVWPDNRGLLVGMLALAGVGLGLFTPANNATVAGAGAAENAGMVSGVLNMTRGIGTSLGVAVAGATYELGSTAITLGVLAGLAGLAALISRASVRTAAAT